MDNDISLERQNEFFGALTEPMPESAIEWRVQRAGEKNGKVWAMVVPYADARWLMQRLDDVFGPMGWWDEYEAGPGGGVVCGLTLALDGVAVTKWDGAPNTDIEDVKGGITDAFKRACVKWNVGDVRALYRVGDLFANIHDRGANYQSKDREGRYPAFKWDPPSLSGNGPRPRQTTEPEPEDDAPGPITEEQKDQIINLRLPLSAHLTDAQKERINQALQGTEEQAAKTLEWLKGKLDSVQGEFAHREA